MSKIVITNVEDAPWFRKTERDGFDTGAQLVGDKEDDVVTWIMNMGPGFKTALHSHSEDEIIYIVDGEITFGDQVLGPRSIVRIPKGEKYQWTAGESGVRFLNIRPASAEYQESDKNPK